MPKLLEFERSYLRELWNEATWQSTKTWLSPDDRYELQYTVRQTSSISIEQVGCGEIIDRQTGRLIARLLRDNYTEPIFEWLNNPTGPVLIWASTYEDGYEMVDLGRLTLVHISETDGHDFIWTDCVLSPDQTHLAVSGCHWACPAEIRILQIQGSPPIIPLPEVARFDLYEGKISWLDDNTLCVTRGNKQQVQYRVPVNSKPHFLQRWQAWQNADAGIVFSPERSTTRVREQGLLAANALLLHEVSATTGEDAMRQHYLHMGWEAYQPIGSRCPCPNECGGEYYPDGYGDCPNCGHIG